jgi:hypothetical protein
MGGHIFSKVGLEVGVGRLTGASTLAHNVGLYFKKMIGSGNNRWVYTVKVGFEGTGDIGWAYVHKVGLDWKGERKVMVDYIPIRWV